MNIFVLKVQEARTDDVMVTCVQVDLSLLKATGTLQAPVGLL